MTKAQLKEILMSYFGVGGDCYTYNLTRVKGSTVTLEDFEEFTEADVDDIVRFVEVATT